MALERMLSKLGFASRSQARTLIHGGTVAVNGRIVTDPHARVDPKRDRILVDGVAPRTASWTLIALHKPRSVVTTRSDPDGRTTVYEFLKDVTAQVVPVGRLDYASTGLLLLTNDTQLANWLTDPATGIVRRYIVTVRGELSDASVRRMEAGVTDCDEALRAATVRILKRSRRETHVAIELTEGRNREIRRMMNALGHEVTRLKRVAFGGIELGRLNPGTWRAVSRDEARRAFGALPRHAVGRETAARTS